MNAKIFRNYLPIILIIILASFLRLFWLDKVPNAVGGDELTYIVNAKAIWLTGADISGTWNPLTAFIFKYPVYTLPQAELPYFLLTPFVGIFGFSLFWIRVPFVLLSVGSVYLIYLITKALFNEKAALAASFLTAVNPWSIYMARTSYESTPAIFFFLLAFYMFLILKGRKILLTIPILFLGFYSYVATKVVFLPFLFAVIFYSYYFVNKKKYLREYLITISACIILVFIFALSIFTTKGPSRVGELISFNSPEIVKEVDSIRKSSIQNFLTPVFENKLTIFSRIVVTKIFKSFSFDYLFVFGDQFFSISRHGFFYILDALFLVLGFAFSFALKRRAFFLLSTIALIGVLPQILYSNRLDNFSIHLALMFAILPIFMGIGISESLILIKNKVYFLSSLLVISIFYIFLVINFLNIYFYQFPLFGNFDFHVRLLSKYVSLDKGKKDLIIYSTRSPDLFKKYIFYANNYNKSTYLEIKNDYKSDNFKFGNINFKGCDRTINASAKNEIVVYDLSCGNLNKDYKHLSISRLSDGGQSYLIFNDSICSKYSLKSYPQNIKISDFSIEDMSAKQFCETYITNL